MGGCLASAPAMRTIGRKKIDCNIETDATE
jgi:hypothetical protein